MLWLYFQRSTRLSWVVLLVRKERKRRQKNKREKNKREKREKRPGSGMPPFAAKLRLTSAIHTKALAAPVPPYC